MNQDRGTQILFAAVFVGCPALYFLWRSIPYLLFYFLPVIIASALFAGLWTVALKAFSEEDYSWLGLIIPLSGIGVFLLVGFPTVYLNVKAGTVPIEGIYFYNAFNSVKASIDHALWSIIPEGLNFLAPTNPVPKQLYDLNTVRWILWISFGIGAPTPFLFLSGRKVRSIEDALEEKYKKIADENKKELNAVLIEKSHALRAAENSQRQVEQERNYYRDEHAKLKALLDFQKKAAGATDQNVTREHKKGVLDSEDL